MWMSPQAVYIHFRNMSGYFLCCRNVSKRLSSLAQAARTGTREWKREPTATGTHLPQTPVSSSSFSLRMDQTLPSITQKLGAKPAALCFFGGAAGAGPGPAVSAALRRLRPEPCVRSRGEAHPWARPHNHHPGTHPCLGAAPRTPPGVFVAMGAAFSDST